MKGYWKGETMKRIDRIEAKIKDKRATGKAGYTLEINEKDFTQEEMQAILKAKDQKGVIDLDQVPLEVVKKIVEIQKEKRRRR